MPFTSSVPNLYTPRVHPMDCFFFFISGHVVMPRVSWCSKVMKLLGRIWTCVLYLSYCLSYSSYLYFC
jgi:hypothetical protein